MVVAMRRAAAATSSIVSRTSGDRSSSRSARSAVPWTAVRGVRSSWASSEVSRCSERIAADTLSRRVSSVAARAVISLVGAPSPKRRPRSCSLHSAAVRESTATGSSAREVTHAAMAAAAAVASTPVTRLTISA